MASPNAYKINVPYGCASFAPQDLRLAEQRHSASFRMVTLEPGSSLRLNSHSTDPLPAPGLEPDLLQPVREHLIRLSDVWSGPATRFVTGYFAAVQAMVEAHGASIEAQGITRGGLYRASDFVFSAPRPLPRAHLHAPLAGGSAEDAAAFVRVDFAFWTGAQFVAVEPGPPRLLPNAMRERRQRLAAAGIVTIEQLPTLPAEWESLMQQLLPPGCSPFWIGETLPQGSRPSNALDAIVALATDNRIGNRP